MKRECFVCRRPAQDKIQTSGDASESGRCNSLQTVVKDIETINGLVSNSDTYFCFTCLIVHVSLAREQ